MNNNRYKYLKIICILLLTALNLTTTINISYADTTNTVELEKNEINILSQAGILIDSTTGQVLYEHSSTEKLFPASTTKLMTAILTLENCNLTDNVTVNPESLLGIPPTYTTAALQSGETLTVEQLLHVLLIPSANDAANVLAYHIAGSIENFSDMMNAKATELGCESTHFVNPNGVHNDNHYSTAKDMALIGKYAASFDTIRQITATTNYALPDLPDGKKREFKTTNTLMMPKNKYYYEYATGLKTGYTNKAKSCIVAMAKKDDIELICVILGGDKTEDRQNERELDCHTLFDYGFNNYSYINICNKNAIVDKSNLSDIPSVLENTNIVYEDNLSVLAPNNYSTDNISTVSWNSDLSLPILKDSVVGTITYNVDGNYRTVNILSAENILPNNSHSISYLFFALLCILGFILFISIYNKKRSSKHSSKKSKTSKNKKYFKHSFY